MADENQGENAGQAPEVKQPTPTPAPPAPQETPPAPPAPAEQKQPEPQPGEADLPEWVLKERKQLREEAAEWRVKLRETEQAKDAELQKLTAQIADLQLAQVRADVAIEHGLPKEIAARLQGGNKEELEADAKALAQLIAAGRPRSLTGGLSPSGGDQDEDPRERARRVRRRH